MERKEGSISLGKKVLIVVVLCLLFLFSGFFLWATDAAKPLKNAQKAMKGNEQVEVIHDKFIQFIPKTGTKTGLIFYPGGKVDPRAYSEIALAAAEAGIFSVIVPMPLNLAVFSPNKAEEVIEAFPEIDEWYLAGHSLGGAMACQYVKGHLGTIKGLILLGSYPAGSSDISAMPIDVLSIHASEDGLSTMEKVTNAKRYLPPDTTYILIEGGNHAQFGDYGAQAGDGEAAVSPYEQMDMTTTEILKFIDQISSNDQQ